MIDTIFRQIVLQNETKVAVIEEGRKFSYQHIWEQKDKLSRYLRYTLGIQAGDQIGIFLPNSVDFIISFFACAEIRAVSIPLNIHFKERELQFFLTRCSFAAFITQEHLYSFLRHSFHQIPDNRFIIISEIMEIHRDSALPVSAAAQHPAPKPDPEADIIFFTTSGSTGIPKIFSKSQRAVIAGAENVAQAIKITKHDRVLSVVPFYFAYGFSNCLFLPLLKGATIVMMKQFLPRQAIQILQDESITLFFGSPFIYSTLAEVSSQDHHLSSIRFCFSAGAMLPRGLGETFFKKFGLRVRALYGLSETGTISIQMGDQDEDHHSLGKPLPNIEIKIGNEYDLKGSQIHQGEILIKSPALMSGYIGDRELTTKSFQQGFFRTGDLGKLDRQGRVCLCGRIKRIINVAGINVDPVEIENVLVAFPKIRDAFVMAVTNKRGIEIIKAIIVAQPDCQRGEVIEYCKKKLADYKIPRLVEFKERLPHNIMGKVMSPQWEVKSEFSSSQSQKITLHGNDQEND
ncbi:class I adenylate-forming enzyme family protein [candidate division CSSED10-310 bacterium]|uniref:Class I adenylate-forming enzyme family protein n=1 Tax=candidate division CSSED10-310 bacterium TaxID=2855610 RepID=A0ABV6YVK3_UNCC1